MFQYPGKSYCASLQSKTPFIKRNSFVGQCKKHKIESGIKMVGVVVPSRIELEYQVPETCVLSIVLRDQYGQNYRKKFWESSGIQLQFCFS